jgi:hypothetical protein
MNPPSLSSALNELAKGGLVVQDSTQNRIFSRINTSQLSDSASVRSGATRISTASTTDSSSANKAAAILANNASKRKQPPVMASTLLAVGVFMHGPEPPSSLLSSVNVDIENRSNTSGAVSDLICVRAGTASEWSKPFSIRGLGRPALVSFKSTSDIIGSNQSKNGTGNGNSNLLSKYELTVSARPCTLPSLGSVFRRTILVTLSPRFLIINHIDPLLAAAFRKKGEGKSESLFSNLSPFSAQIQIQRIVIG